MSSRWTSAARPGVAEERRDAVGAVAHDDPRLAGIVAREARATTAPSGPTMSTGSPRWKLPSTAVTPAGEQRLAAAERRDRAGVDRDPAARLHARDPALARRARVAVGLEPGAGRAFGERRQRALHRALA